MMNFRNRTRTLAAASLLAVSLLSVPALRTPAHAESACTPQTCGTHQCQAMSKDGQIVNYGAGDTLVTRGPDGQLHVWMCDGFTGAWVYVDKDGGGSGNTSGLLGALPTENAPVTAPTAPPSPLAPLPGGALFGQ